jgi:hypothetical protein
MLYDSCLYQEADQQQNVVGETAMSQRSGVLPILKFAF